MACAAERRGGKTWCGVCSLVWATAEEAPDCPRGCVGPGRTGDPELTAEEIRALKASEAEWLNKQRRRGKRGGGWKGRSGIRVKEQIGLTLEAFKLVFRTTPYQSLRISKYGEAWLDRHVKGRKPADGAQRQDRKPYRDD